MGSSEFSSDTIVNNEGIYSVREKFCCNKKKMIRAARNLILGWKH